LDRAFFLIEVADSADTSVNVQICQGALADKAAQNLCSTKLHRV